MPTASLCSFVFQSLSEATVTLEQYNLVKSTEYLPKLQDLKCHTNILENCFFSCTGGKDVTRPDIWSDITVDSVHPLS